MEQAFGFLAVHELVSYQPVQRGKLVSIDVQYPLSPTDIEISAWINVTDQGVSDAGSLEISARAEHDGLIEGVERRDKQFCIGVQWHPERKGHDLLFSALIEAARG